MKFYSERARLVDSSLEASSETSKSDGGLYSLRGSYVSRSLTPNRPLDKRWSSSSDFSMKIANSDNSEPPTITTQLSTGLHYESFAGVNLRPLSHGRQSEISQFHFFMQVIRASVGTGVLALPSAVANAGLAFGMAGIIVTSLITIHCVHLLVECTFFLRRRHNLSDIYLDYGTTAKYSFLFGHRRARKFLWISNFLDFCIGLVQFGMAIVYLTFVGESVKYIVVHYYPNFNPPFLLYLGGAALVILPFVFIRSVRLLSIISGVGNIFMIICMVLIFIHCVQDIPSIKDYPLITDIRRIPLFFGIAIFSFESINVILPTEMALADKRNLLGSFGLLNTSLFIVLIVYVAVAFYGYVKFGADVKGALTYSLPFTPWYIGIIKPLYAILIAMSFGLQYYVLIDTVWLSVTSTFPIRFHKSWLQNVIRLVLFLIAIAIAATVPFVDAIISLTGAFAGSMVCIIIPPTIYTVLFWEHSYEFSCFKLVVLKNVLIIIFGIFGLAIGTYSSIQDINKRLNQSAV